MERSEEEKMEKVGLTLRGKLTEEGKEAITLKVGASEYEIPRNYVQRVRVIDESKEGKIAEVWIEPNAHLIQRVLASAPSLKTPLLAGACDCACNCNCACNCACGGGGSRVFETQQSAFRTQVGASING